MVELVDEGKRALQSNLDDIGPLLDRAWNLKREVASGVSNPEVDSLYAEGLSAGASGGKLLGAGGSGYLAFYVPEAAREQFRAKLPKRLEFRISSQGAGITHES
jgi:D-glycero-alpha-D-manno-heptose-7-phosphate kinase